MRRPTRRGRPGSLADRATVARTLAVAMVALVVTGCMTAAGPSPAGSAEASPSPASSSAASPPATTVRPSSTPAPTSSVGGLTPGLTLTPLVTGLESPVDLAWRPGDPEALYVVEQAGRVRVIRDGVLRPDPVLDIAEVVTAGGEQGLLGLAFPPDADDDRLIVYYTAIDGDQVVSSFRLDPERDEAMRGSEAVILRMADPYPNHNGGSLVFGPDGYLYIGTGDGGSAGDPLGSGRSLETLLAKILRIDVSAGTTGSDGAAYEVPGDNPFLDTPGARPEIWHTGLRNPWRFRFDRATGDLWIGDVGQGSWEEIDRAPAGTGGLDFGWNTMEGSQCYGSGDTCDETGLTLPVSEYGHDEGCSVTGGTVYRGADEPGLVGRYVFADYCSGRFWVLEATAPAAGTDGPVPPVVALDSDRNISAIADDAAGELYATDHTGGAVLRIGLAD